MQCALIVRSRNAIRQWNVDGWTALATIGVLSAEPETEKEFMWAIERYGIEHRLKYRGQKLPAIPQMPDDTAWCFIDLIAHAVICGGDLELPERVDIVQKDEHDPLGGSDIIWLVVPRDWMMERATENWLEIVEARHAKNLSRVARDPRDVLFGAPLREHLAEGILATARQSRPNSADETLQATRDIHAAWLLTSRTDLENRTPREVLLEHKYDIDQDIFFRTQQWSTEGVCPPPLDDRSSAYLRAGFGIGQISFYFDMIRSMMEEGWRHVCENGDITREQLIQNLWDFQQQWLDTSNEETGPSMTPQQIMQAERQRVPITMTDSVVDCDCPLCQAQADGFFGMMGVQSVGFMMFDGHHLELEDEFAFSLSETREEWEERQREYAESAAAFAQQQAMKAEQAAGDDGSTDSIWNRTHVDWDGPPMFDDPLALGAMQVGFCLCEIVGDLKRQPEGREYVLRLNEAYRNFRRSDSPQMARIAAQNLCSELEDTAQAFPGMVAKSADLQSHIHEIMRSASD